MQKNLKLFFKKRLTFALLCAILIRLVTEDIFEQAEYSSLAQSVERMTVNHDVAGSSPAGGAIRPYRKIGSFLFLQSLLGGSNTVDINLTGIVSPCETDCEWATMRRICKERSALVLFVSYSHGLTPNTASAVCTCRWFSPTAVA